VIRDAKTHGPFGRRIHRHHHQGVSMLNAFHSSSIRSFTALVALLAPVAAMAIDGVVLIDQNRALAGNATPGDAPGFPVTITQPGSYRLSGNLTVPDSNTDAILVTAPNVTIDLNGFSILGPNVCTRPPSGLGLDCTSSGSGVGINAPGAVNVVVSNGTVRGMGGAGVALNGATSTAPNRVEKVAATSNGSTGIIVFNGLVLNSFASLNRVHGIGVTSGRVTGSYSVNNFANGLFIQNGAYDNNTFFGNGFAGSGDSLTNAGSVNLGQNLCVNAVCPAAQF
jgi:hypothetical protein